MLLPPRLGLYVNTGLTLVGEFELVCVCSMAVCAVRADS